MRAFSTALLGVSALLGVVASPHERRDHSELAKRMEGTLEKRKAFTNARFTWYPTNTGADACTGKNHQDDSWVVALNMPLFGNSGNGHCGKQIRITANGKSTVATIADACATCYEASDIDLTKGLFQYFGYDPSQGVFHGTWEFVDGSGGDDEPAPKPKPQPKPSPKPEPKPEPKPSPKPSPKPETPVVKKVSSTHKPSSTPANLVPIAKPSSALSKSPALPSPSIPVNTPAAAAAQTPEVPVNAGGDPVDPSIQGGIGNNGPLGGGAISFSVSHAAAALAALAVVAVQAL